MKDTLHCTARSAPFGVVVVAAVAAVVVVVVAAAAAGGVGGGGGSLFWERTGRSEGREGFAGWILCTRVCIRLKNT